MELLELSLKDIKPYANNPRKNDEAVQAVMESIQQCEYIAPIVVDENHVILAGHTRLKALKKLGFKSAQVIVKEGLTDEQKRKYRLLDNKTGELAEWDVELLNIELADLDFGDLSLEWVGVDIPAKNQAEQDEVPEIDESHEPFCKYGDIWQLGEHCLMCGDSTDKTTVEKLMNGEKAVKLHEGG